MTDGLVLDATPDVVSDADLIAAVRNGDSAAFGELWSRHHATVLRFGCTLMPRHSAEDLTSEVFARLLRVLQSGGGPDMNVRPYLLSSVKRLRIDVATRYEQRVSLAAEDVDVATNRAECAEGVALESLQQETLWRAYATLPERWQTVLWHTLIEERPAAEVAPILGTKPNAVAALARRAREGLRTAFVRAHLSDRGDEHCRSAMDRLAARERRGLPPRENASLEEHLAECAHCHAAALEVRDVNQSLRAIVVPVLLGGSGFATAFLSSIGMSGRVAGGTPVGVLRRAARFASQSVSQVASVPAAAAAAVIVAGASAAGLYLAAGGHDRAVMARQDVAQLDTGTGATSAPAPSSTSPTTAAPHQAPRPTADPSQRPTSQLPSSAPGDAHVPVAPSTAADTPQAQATSAAITAVPGPTVIQAPRPTRAQMLPQTPSTSPTPTSAPAPPRALDAVGYAADAPANTLADGAVVFSCPGCSAGTRVGNIGHDTSTTSTVSGTLSVNGVQAPQAGVYTVAIWYTNGDPWTRTGQVSVNGSSPLAVDFAPTGGWDTPGPVTVDLALAAGANTITFSNDAGWAPDFDRIVVWIPVATA